MEIRKTHIWPLQQGLNTICSIMLHLQMICANAAEVGRCYQCRLLSCWDWLIIGPWCDVIFAHSIWQRCEIVKVFIYSPDIPEGSSDYTSITPRFLELTFTVYVAEIVTVLLSAGYVVYAADINEVAANS